MNVYEWLCGMNRRNKILRERWLESEKGTIETVDSPVDIDLWWCVCVQDVLKEFEIPIAIIYIYIYINI